MIEKKANAKGKSVKVTFTIPGENVSERAVVAGDFNAWSEDELPMKYNKKKNVWSCSVTLKPNTSYRFRYKVDGEWQNDSDADAYAANPYLGDDCVLHV